MTPPSPRDRILGSLPVVIVLWGLTVLSGFQAWQGEINFGLPAVFGFVAIAATNSRARVQEQKSFQKEWDSMGRSNRAGTPFMKTPLAMLLGLIVWSVMIAGALSFYVQPETRPLAILVGLGAALPIIVWIFKKRKGSTKPKFKDVAVTQCLKPPKEAPTVQNAYNLLPEYCYLLSQPRR